MKTQLIQLSSIILLLYFLFAFFLVSCNVLEGERAGQLHSLRADERARISYEAETVSTVRHEGEFPGAFKEQYAAAVVPVVSRSKVEVSINRMGQAYWVIEDLEPHRVFQPQKRADLSQKVKRTVIRGDHAIFYDGAGKEIRSGRIDMPDLSQVNRFLEYAGKGGKDVSQKIAWARTQGSAVLEHPNGNLTVKTGKSLAGLYSGAEARDDIGNVEIIELVDTRNNRILATGVYDMSGNILEETRMKYGEESGQLEHIHSVSVTTDRNRVKVKSSTDTYFKYLHVMTH